jgi:large subunit ribosomal protein L28
MALRCELTGKGPIVKNLVSHSNVKTKKWMKPNVHKRRLWSDALNDFVVLRVTTSAIRSVEHVGGLDKFITRQSPELLSKRAQQVRTRIEKARG